MVTLPAWREDGSSVSFAELLRVVGPWVLGPTSWLVGDCEFSSGTRGSVELARLANARRRLTNPERVAILPDGVQLVDGDVSCFAGQRESPFLVLASVRGDAWDVRSSDGSLLDAVRASFPGSADLPPADPDEFLFCRVCGFRNMGSPRGDDGRTLSFAYCPCCGVEWGYPDSSPAGVARFREAWLAAGAPWRDPSSPEDGLTTAQRLRWLGPPAG